MRTRGDRQFLLELGGHTGRAHSSAAIRTARRQRYVVADVYPGWSAAAGRLAVLGAGSTARTLGFEGDGLGEKGAAWRKPARLAVSSSRFRRVFCLSSRSNPPLQPFALALALFELALHALVLLRRRPGGVLFVARRAHTRFYRHLCNSVHPRRQRLPPSTSRPPASALAARTDAVTNYGGARVPPQPERKHPHATHSQPGPSFTSDRCLSRESILATRRRSHRARKPRGPRSPPWPDALPRHR